MGIVISSEFETSVHAAGDDMTSLGVSSGDGMIHYALLTSDESGRHAVESRVIDVDPSDGLDPVGRVNAGIDLVLDAARTAGVRVGPIGVSARTATQRRRLGSTGTGPRRQIHLVSDAEAVTAFLTGTGQIERFGAVLVADCGDTGMSLYTVEPAAGQISADARTDVLSGRALDEALADRVAQRSDLTGTQTRRGRASLVGACRTAKEETSGPDTVGAAPSGVPNGVRLTDAMVEQVARPMVEQARTVIADHLERLRATAGPEPEALVLVGGLANLPVLAALGEDTGLELIRPDTPELAAATGAALLARRSGAGRVTFIGGRRRSGWMPLAPVAAVIGFCCALLVTAVAVGATLTSDSEDAVPSPTSVESERWVGTVEPAWTTTAHTTRMSSVDSPTETPTVTTYPPNGWTPGWATTELPLPTAGTSTWTLGPSSTPSTETAVPDMPTRPTRPTWTIPPNLIPPELIPSLGVPTTAPGDIEEPSPRQSLLPPAGTPPAEVTTTTPAG
ncbi:Hsp70 family protein [Gordonia sp. NPDC003376]